MELLRDLAGQWGSGWDQVVGDLPARLAPLLASRDLGPGESGPEARSGAAQGQVFELLLGTGGRRSEVAGIRIGDVDLPAKRVWIREPVVEVEGKLVRRRKPKR